MGSGSSWTTDHPLPVQISLFEADVVDNNSVKLNWTTIAEVNNYGFYVERCNENEINYTLIPNSFIAGHGSTLEPHSYTFTDNTITSSGVYCYRLQQIDNDGLIHYYGPIVVSFNPMDVKDGLTVPAVYKLNQNYPNPFNPTTKISFSLEKSGYTTLKLHNVMGQEIETLFNKEAEAGKLYVINLDANKLSSGIYFIRLTSGSFNDFRKIVMIK
ncbi:MAG: T9SS type A sorting domain-containing protein [Bacteroidota bacterium]|nr:T9SS type A sorting domain-containing protein [Bacteroidota bacterium]